MNYWLDAEIIKIMVKDKLVNSRRTKLGTVLGDSIKTGVNVLFMLGVKVESNC